MRRKVIRAKVHDMQVVLPGIGSLEKELPPVNKTVKMEMFLDSEYPSVLLVQINGGEYFVPLANVQIGFLAPEEPKKVIK